MKSILIGNKKVGEGNPVYIVFEAGQTHTGLKNAKELIDAAANSGANAIKFQKYDSERLVPDPTVMDEYDILINKKTGERATIVEPMIDSIKRHEFSPDDWVELKKYADKRGITFFSTVDFPEDVDFLAGLGVDVFKISSADINHHHFIRYVASKGVPLMFDTGSSTIGEVERAVDISLAQGNGKIVIHHCPSGYPAHIESINLKIITTLKQMFEFPIAFSDHSPGWNMDIAAVALGVHMIEKTITSSTTIRDAEHIMSVEVQDAKRMVKEIRELEMALGNTRRVMTKKEHKAKKNRRRSLFAKNDLNPGDVLTDSNIDFNRPGHGLSVSYVDEVLGKKIVKQISKGTMLKWEDFQ